MIKYHFEGMQESNPVKRGEKMKKKKSIFVVVGNGEITFARLTPRRAEEFQQEDRYEYSYLGPFENVRTARVEAIKYLIHLAGDGHGEESERLVEYIFKKAI